MKFCLLAFACLVFLFSCTKNPAPAPPVHDTVTVVKNDTTKVIDTLYVSPDPMVQLTKGLLLYLPFSGSIADSSGNANPTVAMNGAGLTYDTHGYANNAFAGNGSNQVVVVTNNGSIKFDTAYTVSLDFMTTDLSTRHTFLSMVDYATGNGPTFEVGMSLPDLPSQLAAGVDDISAGCSDAGGSNPAKIADTTSFVPSLGAWYNVITIYHRGSVQVYLNGSLISSRTGSGTLANLCPASEVIVGGWWVNDPIGVAGKLDNIRLYNRVLNAHEIAALAANYQVTSTAVRRVVR